MTVITVEVFGIKAYRSPTKVTIMIFIVPVRTFIHFEHCIARFEKKEYLGSFVRNKKCSSVKFS